MESTKRVGKSKLVWGLLIAIVCVVGSSLGILVLLELPLTLAFGWAWYLDRVVPQLHSDPWMISTAIVCLVSATLGTHVFLRWLSAAMNPDSEHPQRWRWKWTGILVGMVALMLASGTAFTGIVHQTSGLIGSSEPLIEKDAMWVIFYGYHMKEREIIRQPFPRRWRKDGQYEENWRFHILLRERKPKTVILPLFPNQTKAP